MGSPIVGAVSVFFCLVIVLHLVSTSVAAYPLDSIESCLLNEDQKPWSFSKEKIPPLFHLHFGDPAVEILNALNSSDIRRIETLRKCVELEDSSLYEDTNSETKGTLIHQGRITYLSGIFQLLLPAILLKLKAAATHGIKGADWDTPSTNDLGIKSIQYSSVLTGFEMKSKQQLAEERRTRQHIITIGDKPRKVYDGILDTHADEHVAQYMQRQLNSTYTMIVNLSSRTEFFGGNVLVDKGEIDERSTPDGDASSDDEPEAKYNNADILLKFQKQPDHPEFNALKTKYQRYTPEQGSVLLIRSECSHGIHKVTKGKMNMLILEFWPYADALTGSHFQPAEERGSLQMNEEL